MTDCELFSRQLAPGVYQISDALHGPNTDGYSFAPGKATANSYLVNGKEKAALIDQAVNSSELYGFAQRLAGKPLTLFLTHGHPDHVFGLDKVGEGWLHPADHRMIREGITGISAPVHNVKLHPLEDRQLIDLGERTLQVLHLPGHTPGSVLFHDKQSGILFVGDTCARRLLYGVTPTIPLSEHCKKLKKLMNEDFNVMYSAHDRCPLDKEYIRTILRCIETMLPQSKETVMIPGLGFMRNLRYGKEDTLEFFDLAIMEQYMNWGARDD